MTLLEYLVFVMEITAHKSKGNAQEINLNNQRKHSKIVSQYFEDAYYLIPVMTVDYGN